MLRKHILLYIFIFISAVAFAQVPKADRYFKKGDFIEAASLYEEALLEKKSKYVLERLSDCYYNTYQYNAGIMTLKAMINGDFVESDKSVAPKYHFRYYQLLSATSDYEKAIEQLVVYRGKIKQPLPNVQEAIEMVETFRLKKDDFEIEKASFNSEATDFGAIKFNDSIYFASDRGESGLFKNDYKWTHRPFLDIYSIGQDSTSNYTGEPKALPKTINSSLHEGALTFSKDGNTMYFSRSNLVNGKKVFSDNDKNQIQLYVTKKVDGKWSEPQKLSFCSDQYNYQHPALSADEKTLYYSSDAKESIGSYDLFSVAINDDNTFGKPKNLGDKINTTEREQYPYISDGGNLFFASNGHLGLGLLDLFTSEFQNGEYNTPINLGAPINSQFDDFSMAYSDAKEGYFSSNRDNANDDIFYFKQIGDLYVREFVNLFEIKDSISENPVPNTFVILKDNKDEIVYENILDEEGKFTANLLPGEYTIDLKSPGYESLSKNITIANTNNDHHILKLKKLYDIDTITEGDSDDSKKVIANLIKDEEPPKIYIVDGKIYFDVPYIFFDFDRWDIREDSKILLNNLALKLDKYKSIKIRINAHTDNRGTQIYNQVLSEKRAQSTRNYLTKIGGIDRDRISFKGYGESEPLIKCEGDCTEEQHQKNRRSQFELIEY